MIKLSEELEGALDQLVDDREEYYLSHDNAKVWIYQDFAEWLVKKFEKEVYHAKTR